MTMANLLAVDTLFALLLGRIVDKAERERIAALRSWNNRMFLRISFALVALRGAREAIKPHVSQELDMLQHILAGDLPEADSVQALQTMLEVRFAELIEANQDMPLAVVASAHAIGEYLFAELKSGDSAEN